MTRTCTKYLHNGAIKHCMKLANTANFSSITFCFIYTGESYVDRNNSCVHIKEHGSRLEVPRSSKGQLFLHIKRAMLAIRFPSALPLKSKKSPHVAVPAVVSSYNTINVENCRVLTLLATDFASSMLVTQNLRHTKMDVPL